MTKICVLAGNEHEAYAWASNQGLDKEQYFYPKDLNDLLFRTNFHVIVIGTAGMNTPPSYFEKVYQTALKQGKINRI